MSGPAEPSDADQQVFEAGSAGPRMSRLAEIGDAGRHVFEAGSADLGTSRPAETGVANAAASGSKAFRS